jgi:hypothetical protein
MMKIFKINRQINQSATITTIVFIFALFLVAVLGGLLFIRNFAYFRDYSITFEGAYRLSLGQIPFKDFGSPVGPIAFIIPAVFFKLFGANLLEFQLAQLFTNCLMLILLILIFRRLCLPFKLQFISLSFFTFTYLIFLTHPWYNSTAFLTLELVILFSLYVNKYLAFLTGFFCGITLLTKQDFGAISFFNALVIYLFTYSNNASLHLKNKISDFLILKYFHEFLTKSIFLIFGLVTCLYLFILSTDSYEFLYWFNYGQNPHHPRSIHLRSLTQNSYGMINLIAIILCFKYKRFNLLIAALIIFNASLTRQTSGLGFTHYYFVLALPIIIYEIYSCKFRFKLLLLSLTLILSLQLMKKPLRDLYYVIESIALHQPEHFFFDYREISQPLVQFPANLVAFNKESVPIDTLQGILKIKSFASKLTYTPRVLNLSELTPIYAELDIHPPKQQPLWYHTNISFFPQEINLLNHSFKNQDYDLILLQGAHEGLSPTYQKFYDTLSQNQHYKLLVNIYYSPGVGTGPCKEKCDGNIFVFFLEK